MNCMLAVPHFFKYNEFLCLGQTKIDMTEKEGVTGRNIEYYLSRKEKRRNRYRDAQTQDLQNFNIFCEHSR